MTLEQELLTLRAHCQSFASDRNMQDVASRLTEILAKARTQALDVSDPVEPSVAFKDFWQNGLPLASEEAKWAWAGWQGVFSYLSEGRAKRLLVPGDEDAAQCMMLSGLQWYLESEAVHDIPDQIAETVVGDTVSIDVSTCDEDAGHRVFGKILEWQRPGPDGGRVWLCDLDQFNYDPTQPVVGDNNADVGSPAVKHPAPKPNGTQGDAMTEALKDDKGKAIAEGDTVMTTAYGGSVPLWLSSHRGQVVGFTRRGRVKVQFHIEAYDDALPYRSVPPHYLRVVVPAQDATELNTKARS